MTGFDWPPMLWGLVLLPLTVAGMLLAARARERRRRQLADQRLWAEVARPAPAAAARWTSGLQLLALAALLLAAARPQAAPPWLVNRASVVIALDASRSMLADDLQPSRLEAARALAEAFVRQAPASTRIGLVSFSDAASPLVLPTTDHQKVLAALAEVAPASNTSLVAAVVGGVRAMPGREGAAIPEALAPAFALQLEEQPEPSDLPADLPPASLLILSDGVDNVAVGEGLQAGQGAELAARFATDQQVRLFTVPMGREGGAVSVIEGQPYFVPFESDALRRLAELGGGRALDPEDEAAREQLFRELGRQMRWEATPMEVSAPLAGTAALLLVAAGFIGMRWQRRVP